MLLSLVRAPALPPQHAYFGSQSHTPSTRCLRFRPRVTATPATSLPSCLLGFERPDLHWQADTSFPIAQRIGLLSKVRRHSGLGLSSSGPWARAVGDMRIPALCPRHALALALPSTFFPPRSPPPTRRPVLFEASSVLCSLPPTFRSGFGSSPSRTDPGPPWRLRAAGGLPGSDTIPDGSNWDPGGACEPRKNGPAHVACGGSQRLGLHGKSLSRLNAVLVISLCTLRDHRRR